MENESLFDIVGRALTSAWKLVNEEFRNILHILVLFYFPLNIIIGFVPDITHPAKMPFPFSLLIITGMVLHILATLTLIDFCLKKQNRSHASSEDSIQFALGVFWPVFATSLMASAIIFVGFLFLIIPGLIFLVYTLFLTQIMVTQKKYFTDAIRASIDFVRDRWWQIFGLLTIMTMIIFLIATTVILAFQMLPDTVFNRIASATIIDAFGVFYVLGMTYLFLEMREKVRAKIKRKSI